MEKVPGIDRLTEKSARITVFWQDDCGKQQRAKRTVQIPLNIQGKENKVHDWLVEQRALLMETVRRKEIANRVLTVESWSKIWLEEYIKPNRKTKTYDEHENNLRIHILPELGGIKLEKLTPMRITMFANDLRYKSNGRGGELSSVTIGNVRRTLSAMLERARKQGLMINNPATLVEWPQEKRRRGKALLPEQYSVFFEALQSEKLVWRAIFMLMATTGMRRGEAVGLNWSKVDLKERKIIIDQAAVMTRKGVEIGAPKTDAGIRVNYLNDDVTELLKKLRIQQKMAAIKQGRKWIEDGPVFINEERWERLRPDSVTNKFVLLQKKCGLGIRLHDLRHSYVSAAIHEGAAVTDIARQVGHAGTDVTLRVYAHAFGDSLESSRRLSNMVERAYVGAR